MTYEEYLKKLAEKRNTTPEKLGEQYGDMLHDMWTENRTVEEGIDDLDGDDHEYSEEYAEQRMANLKGGS